MRRSPKTARSDGNPWGLDETTDGPRESSGPMSDLLTLQDQNTFEPLIVLPGPALRRCSLTQHNSDDQVLSEVKCALTVFLKVNCRAVLRMAAEQPRLDSLGLQPDVSAQNRVKIDK